VTIVIVSFNTRELLSRCLEALPAAVSPFGYETIVVDNGSIDGTIQMLREDHPEVRLLERPDNPGFAASTNAGLGTAGGRLWVWLNPDCEPRPGSLAALARYVDEHDHVGAAGPRLIYPDGRTQPSAQAFPHSSLVLYRFLRLGRLARVNWIRRLLRTHGGPTTRGYAAALDPASAPRSVDWVTGACLVTRADRARSVGPLDEGYFMYCEDTDWCQRVRAAGLEVHQVPESTVVHHVGASAASNPMLTFHFYRSMLRYFRRYRPREFGLLRAVMLFLFGVRGIASEFVHMFRRGRAHPWWRLAALCVSSAAWPRVSA